jgi:hypothetical protein
MQNPADIDMASMSAEDLKALGLRLLKTSEERIEAQHREEMEKTCTIPIRDANGVLQFYEVQRGGAEALMTQALNDGSTLTVAQLIELLKKQGVTEIELEFKESADKEQTENGEIKPKSKSRIRRFGRWLVEDHRLLFNKGKR